jgi:hypothetical protein
VDARRNPAAVIRQRDIREALVWVDATGAVPILEALVRPTGKGRPRQLPVRTLLIGIKLAIDTAKTACLTDVHGVLLDLPRSVQRQLAVRDPRTGREISVHQVRRLFTAMTAVVDPSQHTSHVTPATQAVRLEVLQDLVDRLVGASAGTSERHPGGYAVDGTGTWSWARGKHRGELAADPDATWGVKTHKSGREESYFGYELHAVVRVGPPGGKPNSTPCVAERIVVRPASTNATADVLAALRRMQDADLRVREVIVDRGYSYKTNWTPGVIALGLDPVHDLHANQYGARGTHAGARIVTGVPHCPAMPTALDDIRRPERLAAGPELDRFTDMIAEREHWALRRISLPDLTGKERYECPARAGKIKCALHKPSLKLGVGLPTVTNPPADPGSLACCSQRTITIPGTVDPKARQRYYWGSAEWIAAFSRRSRVEGWFGNLKSENTEALGRGAFRVMGLAKTTIMLGLYTAATNMRLLRAWARRTHNTEELTEFLLPVQVAELGAVDITTGELEQPPPDSSPATRQQH